MVRVDLDDRAIAVHSGGAVAADQDQARTSGSSSECLPPADSDRSSG
jgi:hypothetical protein